MEIADIIGPAIPAIYIVMLIVERVIPAKKLPKVRFWVAKGFVFFLFSGFLNTVLPMVFAQLLGTRSLFHLGGLPLVPGAILGAVVADLFSYAWHRFAHTFHPVWRFTHQMHHSAERMDVSGLSYSHPADSIVSFSVTALAITLLGLSPAAAAVAGFIGFLLAVFQHANIRTPKILGYFVARPEQHGLHHARGVHAYNYASFPLWDLLFGTFRNPDTFAADYGFWDGASTKVGSMLIGRDVAERT